jgi:hypothetical protein
MESFSLGPRSTVPLVALAQRQTSLFPCAPARHALPWLLAVGSGQWQEPAENMSPAFERSPCKLNSNVAGQAALSVLRLARMIQCAFPIQVPRSWAQFFMLCCVCFSRLPPQLHLVYVASLQLPRYLPSFSPSFSTCRNAHLFLSCDPFFGCLHSSLNTTSIRCPPSF